MRLEINYNIPFGNKIQHVVTLLQAHTSACVDTENEKKLVFLTRQLELLSQKQFSVNDYCFALESYPKCSYEQLRNFLVLRETFSKIRTLQQKNAVLLQTSVKKARMAD